MQVLYDHLQSHRQADSPLLQCHLQYAMKQLPAPHTFGSIVVCIATGAKALATLDQAIFMALAMSFGCNTTFYAYGTSVHQIKSDVPWQLSLKLRQAPTAWGNDYKRAWQTVKKHHSAQSIIFIGPKVSHLHTFVSQDALQNAPNPQQVICYDTQHPDIFRNFRQMSQQSFC